LTGKTKELRERALALGTVPLPENKSAADVALLFMPLPRIPVALLFWDAASEDDFQAEAKLLFDETIVEHLDIESIVFLSERLRHLLCD
jgi:hypothetical protein